MENKFSLLPLFFAIIFTIFFGVHQAHAIVELMDGKLVLNGYFREVIFVRDQIPKEDKRFHNTNMDFARTSAIIEALYKYKDEGDFIINFYGGMRYWYEMAPTIDDQFHDKIPHRVLSEYQHPRDDDLVTEAYVDIIRGPWQFRIGKQIVIWGETDIQRTADVVNPLDLRLGTPGIDDWENIKIGLYMFRGFYQSQLPGNLLFELIFVPGDYEMTRIPYEGTHYGPSPGTTSVNPGHGPGITHWIFEKMRRDEPGWSLRDNWELGFRLRGTTWNIDWTLLYYNSRMDSGVARTTINDALVKGAVIPSLRSLDTGEDIRFRWPGERIFRFPRTSVIGGTAQTVIDRLHGSTWKLEWFYELGTYFNKKEGDTVTDIVQRDALGFGLNFSDRYTLPYVTHKFFDDKKISISLTLFWEKILNHDSELDLSGRPTHRPQDSTSTSIAFNIQQFFWHYEGMFMLTGSYSPIGKYFIAPIFAYVPGDKWRYELGFPIYGKDKWHSLADRDSVLIRVRYEW